MSGRKTTQDEVRELIASVVGAAEGLSPWELPQSVLGRIRRALPPDGSEYRLFASRDVRRTARYLTNILVPSSQRRGPEWLPAPLREVFFHQTRIFRRPDPEGSYDAFSNEAWFFINGILTDAGMAGWNAEYLARLFRRPFTVIQNATDGPFADLLECAAEKAFGMNGEATDVAFPEIYRALKDDSKDRVVIIAHSQGTLISSVIVRLLRLVYEHSGDVMTDAHRDDELAELRRTGVTLDPGDFEDVTTDELRRLEIYCFANCATEMRYVDPEAHLPWIESLGNEHDLVARLGMLAPGHAAEDVSIDGPLWVCRGAWGHLLNHHYLRDIDRAQGGGSGPGPATATAAPYERHGSGGDREAAAPRLFGYLYGGTPAAR